MQISKGFYWIVMVLESIGSVILLVYTIPVYRQIKSSGKWWIPNVILPIIGGILLIQIPFWLKNKYKWDIKVRKSNLSSIIISFISWAFLIFVGVMFAIVFVDNSIQNFYERFIITVLVMLFSIFCFSRDLNELSERFL